MRILDGPDYQEFVKENGVLVLHQDWLLRHPISPEQKAQNRIDGLRRLGIVS